MSITAYPELEIELSHDQADTYKVKLNFKNPKTSVERLPKVGSARIVLEDLRTLQWDPQNYGEALTAQVFSDKAILSEYKDVQVIAESGSLPLRLRLSLASGAERLNDLRWELLCDPLTKDRLATSQRFLFSRYALGEDWRDVIRNPKAELQGVVAVSGPSDYEEWDIAEVKVSQEVERALKATKPTQPTVVGSDESLTRDRLIAALQPGVDFVYLLCHGVLENKSPFLYLQQEDGTGAKVAAEELVARIREFQKPPLLMILASCESAGTKATSAAAQEPAMQESFAAQLAAAGVPAVVAMQGKISQETLEQMMPVFFTELLRDGQIDRAMAAARGVVREREDSWMPVLFLRLKSGRLWEDPSAQAEDGGRIGWIVGKLGRTWLLHRARVLTALALTVATWSLFYHYIPDKPLSRAEVLSLFIIFLAASYIARAIWMTVKKRMEDTNDIGS